MLHSFFLIKRISLAILKSEIDKSRKDIKLMQKALQQDHYFMDQCKSYFKYSGLLKWQLRGHGFLSSKAFCESSSKRKKSKIDYKFSSTVILVMYTWFSRLGNFRFKDTNKKMEKLWTLSVSQIPTVTMKPMHI